MVHRLILAPLLGSSIAGCTQSGPLEESGKPVSEYQQRYWTQFKDMRAGATEAQVQSAYGQPNLVKLDYGTGVAFFEQDRLTNYGVMEQNAWVWTASFTRGHKIVVGDNRFKLDWPIEQSMSRSSFEALMGMPERRCSYYVVHSFEHIFCYKAGKLVTKSRAELEPQP